VAMKTQYQSAGEYWKARKERSAIRARYSGKPTFNVSNYCFCAETSGSHFPIARHIVNAKGEKAILFTTRDYSVTTSGHKNAVRGAIPSGTKIFYVQNPDETPDIREIKRKEENAAKLVARAKKARANKAGYLSSAESLINDAKELSKFFKIKCKIAMPQGLKNAAEQILQAQKEQKERKKRAEQETIKRAQEAIEKWKNGEFVSIPWNVKTAFGRIQEGELVTSKGARVPLEHVLKVAPLVRSLITQGKAYKANGHTIHLGHYRLDEITTDGNLRAGCHLFEKPEVLRILDLVEKEEV
jgi:hypothetical protein